MFGSHLSIAGGLHNALIRAEELGLQTVQIFNKSQQQWRAKPLTDADIQLWRGHVKRLRFSKTVSHASYLINIGSPVQALWQKSLDSLIEEHQRCTALGISYLVFHPGAHCGQGEDAALEQIARSIDLVHLKVPDTKLITCLEITAGQGSCVGHRLEHLAQIIARVERKERMGVCLDTAHLFAAGYDFRGRKYAALRKEISRTVGLRAVKVWHLNDSKKELGSRVDRHDHIGEGKIGVEGFRPIVNDAAWNNVPKILETPKDDKAPDGRDWDIVNLERLKSLIKRR